MSDTSDYQPVDCGFYDELGLRMMRGVTCRFVLVDGDEERWVETTIEDLFTEGNAEYVRLGTGAVYRLDRIRRVDDVAQTHT